MKLGRLSCLLLCFAAHAQIALVNHVSAGPSGTNTGPTTTPPRDMTGATTLLACTSAYNGPGISDSSNNKWVLVAEKASGGDIHTKMWASVGATTSSAQTFTVTNGDGATISAAGFNGIESGPDGTPVAAVGLSPGTVSPSKPNELVFDCGGGEYGSAWTVASPMTLLDSVTTSTVWTTGSAYQIQGSTASSVTPTFANSGGGPFVSIAASFYSTLNPSPPSITTTSLPVGIVGQPYSSCLGERGGKAPYTYALVSGTLPAGISLGASTGCLTGTSSSATTASFVIGVTDSQGATSQSGTLTFSSVTAVGFTTSGTCPAQSDTGSPSCQITGVPAGGTIVVNVTNFSAGALAMADTATCTWAVPSGWPYSAYGVTDEVWVGTNCAAGTHTLSATAAAQNELKIWAGLVQGFSFLEATSAPNSNSYSLAPVSAAFNTTQTFELVLSFVHSVAGGGASYSPQSGFTTLASSTTPTEDAYGYGYLPGPVNGNTVTWTQSSGNQSIVDALVLAAPAAAIPTITPTGGTYSPGQTVTLATTTSGASIYYTLNTDTPTTASKLYTGPITLNGSAIVTAVAVKPGIYSGYSTPVNYLVGAGTLAGVTPGPLGALNGWVPSPSDAWHTDISGYALDAMSSTITSASVDLSNAPLNPDFTIPYTVVDSTVTPFVAVTYRPDIDGEGQVQGDTTYLPLPSSLPIEWDGVNPNPQNYCPGPSDPDYIGDNHSNIFDRATGTMYENGYVHRCPTRTPSISTVIATIWDYTNPTGNLRPYGFTSVDAAGLSVFEGLVRYDEIVAGVINHAIRFTAKNTRSNVNGGWYVAPAVHAAGNLGGTDNIIGMRIRLKASFNISTFSPTSQIILTAMKKYGMILADNGTNMDFQGTPDPRWPDLTELHTGVHASDFEVVSIPSGNYYNRTTAPSGNLYDANNYPAGAVPVVNSLTAASSTIAAGACTTLSWTTTGASYSYFDKLGRVPNSGSQAVCPVTTTTYSLRATNRVITPNSGGGGSNGTYNMPGDWPAGTVTVTVNGVVPPVTLPPLFGGYIVPSGRLTHP